MGQTVTQSTNKTIPIAAASDLLRLAAEGDTPFADGELDVNAARLGRQIASSAKRIIGLLPAGSTSDALAVAEPVASAIVALSGSMVLILDPEQRALTAPKGAGYGAMALSRGVVAIAPHETAVPGAKGEALRRMLEFVAKAQAGWRAALVDLTGCALPGELFDVLTLVDGIVIVGRAGQVTEAELKRSSARVPAELGLGIILAE